MKNSREKKWEEHLLPIDLIQAVAQGELEACNHVVADFKKYIEKVCTRMVKDKNGNEQQILDQNMVEAIEQKLLYALTYKYRVVS